MKLRGKRVFTGYRNLIVAVMVASFIVLLHYLSSQSSSSAAPISLVKTNASTASVGVEGSVPTYTASAGSNLRSDLIDMNILLSETNKYREQNNDPALDLNVKLNESALLKCNDMVNHNYWSHYEPGTNAAPWHYFVDAGYAYTYAGENLARSINDATSVVKAWMDSPEHRENILNAHFSQVGFAVCKSSNYTGSGPALIVVQHLAAPAV